MQVPILSIVFMGISAIVSIGVPIALFLFFRKKYGARVMPMLIGIAGFFIFALVLESLVHSFILGNYIIRDESPALYIVYGIFMAGIFEETARFISFNILKKRYNGFGTALSYGIGHGGIESVLLAGASMIMAIITSILFNAGSIEVLTKNMDGDALAAINNQLIVLITSESYLFLIGGMERLFAIGIQLGLTVIVFYAVYGTKKIWLYPLAILLHAAIDIPAAAFQAGVLTSIVLVEAVVFVSAVLMLLFARYLHNKFKPELAAETVTVAGG